MTPHIETDPGACRRVCEALLRHRRVVVTSHMRPDGDSIGSSLALAWALRETRHRRPRRPPRSAAAPARGVPRASPRSRSATRSRPASTPSSCSSAGTSRARGSPASTALPVINIDHHPGNTGYGDVQWFDGTAAACGEMVFEIIAELGVPLTGEMATQLFVAIVTDTGSFRYPGVSPRTFSICARLLEAGADPGQRRPQAVRQPHARAGSASRAPSCRRWRWTRAAAWRCSRLDRRDAGRVRRRRRGDRRPDQPAAQRQGHSGGGVLQGGRGRPVAREPAVEGRHRRRAAWPAASAAAATRTRPAAR